MNSALVIIAFVFIVLLYKAVTMHPKHKQKQAYKQTYIMPKK